MSYINKVNTTKLSNRILKEIRWDDTSENWIAWAERQKARLENEGYSLRASNSSPFCGYLAYVKYN